MVITSTRHVESVMRGGAASVVSGQENRMVSVADYKETFLLVAMLKSIRILLASFIDQSMV